MPGITSMFFALTLLLGRTKPTRNLLQYPQVDLLVCRRRAGIAPICGPACDTAHFGGFPRLECSDGLLIDRFAG
jgi:hypothetical protein